MNRTRRFALRSRSSSGSLTVGAMRRKRGAATCRGTSTRLSDLVALHACADIGPGRLPLEVHDRGVRLVVDASTRGPNGECKVRVLVIGRRVTRVEPADLAEQRARHREARAGDSSRPRAGSCTPACRDRRRDRSSTPSRRARRCRPPPAGGRRDRRASRRRGRHPGRIANTREQRVEPTRGDDRVVVEEHDVLAARELDAAIAAAEKAEVRRDCARIARRSTGDKRLRHRLRRSVVDDDHLERSLRPYARATLCRHVNVSSGLP